MSEETAKELTQAIKLLIKKIDSTNENWLTGDQALKILGIPFTKGTARKHLNRLRSNGTLKEYKKEGRHIMYSKIEVLKKAI